MKPNEPSWEVLNAYVDGELAPSDAAVVVSAAAADERLAAKIATLARLKAAVATGPELPPRQTLLPTEMRRRPMRRTALAAAAALLIAVIVVQRWPDSAQDDAATLLQLSQLAHQHWQSAAEVLPGTALDISRYALPLPPDLRPAGLRLALTRAEQGAGREGLHLGYLGTRGCRFSLLIWPQIGAKFEQTAAGRGGVAAWRAGSHGYVALAADMAPERFAMIVAWLRQTTRTLDQSPLLAKRGEPPPCRA